MFYWTHKQIAANKYELKKFIENWQFLENFLRLATVYAVIFAGSNFRGFGAKICTSIFAVLNFCGHRSPRKLNSLVSVGIYQTKKRRHSPGAEKLHS